MKISLSAKKKIIDKMSTPSLDDVMKVAKKKCKGKK